MPQNKSGNGNLTLSAPKKKSGGVGLTLSAPRTHPQGGNSSGLTISNRSQTPRGMHSTQPSRALVREALAQQHMPSTTIGEGCSGLADIRDTLEVQEAVVKRKQAISRACKFAAEVGVLKRLVQRLCTKGHSKKDFLDLKRRLGEVADLDPKSRGKRHLMTRLEIEETYWIMERTYRMSKMRRCEWGYLEGEVVKTNFREVQVRVSFRISPWHRPLGGEAHQHFIQEELNNQTEDPSDMIPLPTIDSPKEEDVETVIFVCEQTVEEFWRTQMSA